MPEICRRRYFWCQCCSVVTLSVLLHILSPCCYSWQVRQQWLWNCLCHESALCRQYLDRLWRILHRLWPPQSVSQSWGHNQHECATFDITNVVTFARLEDYQPIFKTGAYFPDAAMACMPVIIRINLELGHSGIAADSAAKDPTLNAERSKRFAIRCQMHTSTRSAVWAPLKLRLMWRVCFSCWFCWWCFQTGKAATPGSPLTGRRTWQLDLHPDLRRIF